MRIFSIYKDFFRFLENLGQGSKKWDCYNSLYYEPHHRFLEIYFSRFPLLDSSGLKARVESVKASDYSLLKGLIGTCPPDEIVEEAYKRAIGLVPPPQEPDVYLLVGFFSPDGFVLDLGGKPVICFGLERFKDFHSLKILFSHEYAHFLMNLSEEAIPEQNDIKWMLISEGIATYFSFLCFPDRPLFEHLFFSRDVFNWCQEHEADLKEIFLSKNFSDKELESMYAKGDPDKNFPPRSGKYLGFQAVKRYLAQQGAHKIRSLLLDSKLALKSLFYLYI